MQYDENAEKYGYEGEMTPLKCDELQAYKGDVYIPVYGSIADADVYLKKDADKAIAELKDVIHELQVDLEGAKATAYAESVDAGMRERKLRRALFIAHAIKAKFKWWWMSECKHNESCKLRPDPRKIKKFTNSAWVCSKSQEKCREKAEQYK